MRATPPSTPTLKERRRCFRFLLLVPSKEAGSCSPLAVSRLLAQALLKNFAFFCVFYDLKKMFQVLWLIGGKLLRYVCATYCRAIYSSMRRAGQMAGEAGCMHTYE